MHLIFDLDGTLVDSRPGILYSLRLAVCQVFPGANPEMFVFEIGPPVRKMFQAGLKMVSEDNLDRLEAAFRAIYDDVGWRMTAIYPNVIETLDRLAGQGIPLYVATNKPMLASKHILTHLNLVSYFVDVLSPDSRCPKFSHKTEMLEALLAEHDIPTSEAVYVGDSMDDFYSAKQCGIGFIGIEYGYGRIPSDENSITRINSFEELLEKSTCLTRSLYGGNL